ncbi:hypothetical protein FDG95_gp001 [Pectobacterium phage vB_PcaM_CBB]|uniref:Uncharacterized protein n=1 Tax=Pectobacterium phage vB_PcaM_CBB TaxID=2772511 RepID=A0A1L2CU67_9CAUD|nr:hypothetical protein FDG95_gp001 [Pectobacterium phage vB_PcaM_CBB]AMM43566.1 hypothetical protein CBB_1 [Pectobacterium phage vB_PcaM_CBB]
MRIAQKVQQPFFKNDNMRLGKIWSDREIKYESRKFWSTLQTFSEISKVHQSKDAS